MKCSYATTYQAALQVLLVISIFLCLVLISACGQQSDKVVRFGLASAPVTLDPRFATDAISTRINRLIYRQLVDFDASSNPVPSLATWYKISPQHFRFELQKKYRLFHDGTKLTSNDVKSTYKFILDEKNASPHRASLSMIKDIQVIDDDTIDFILNVPDPLFPGYLEIGILPEHKVVSRHPFNTHPIGSGPFQFVAWSQQNRLELARIRDGQPFEFVHVKDENTRVLKLLRGEIDMIQNDLDAELIKYLYRQNSVSVESGKGTNFSYIGFNLQDDIVSQQAVRQAVALAVNREAIIKYLFAGNARLANSVLQPDHWAGHDSLEPYSYDPQRAKKIIMDLGFSNNNPLRLVYKTSTNPFRVRLATILQSQLSAVGIDVEIRTFDWGTFYGDIKSGNFQMYTLSWVGVNLPDIFRYVFHSESFPPEGANRGRYINREIDNLLDQAKVTQGREAQSRIYQRIQQILLTDLPYVPLWYEHHVFAYRKEINGYRISPDGNYDGLVNVTKVQVAESS